MHQWIYRWSACWSLYKMKALASKVKAEGGKWKRREVKNDNAEVFLDSTSSEFRKSSVRVSVMKQGSVQCSAHVCVSASVWDPVMTKISSVQCTPPRTRSPGSHPGATAGLILKKAWCTPVGPPPKGGRCRDLVQRGGPRRSPLRLCSGKNGSSFHCNVVLPEAPQMTTGPTQEQHIAC